MKLDRRLVYQVNTKKSHYKVRFNGKHWITYCIEKNARDSEWTEGGRCNWPEHDDALNEFVKPISFNIYSDLLWNQTR